MKDAPFSQTVIGALLIAIVAGVVVVVLQPYLDHRGNGPVRPILDTADPKVSPANGSASSSPSTASEKAVDVDEDGSVIWRSPSDGVTVSWNSDGTVRGVTSRYTVSVSSTDSVAVSNALVVAEERAKAAIVRFMQESVSSERVVSQVTSDLRALDGAGIDRRTLIATFSEVTRSYASGQLSGVAVLQREFDTVRKLAWVVVGIDARSLNASKALRQMMEQ